MAGSKSLSQLTLCYKVARLFSLATLCGNSIEPPCLEARNSNCCCKNISELFVKISQEKGNVGNPIGPLNSFCLGVVSCRKINSDKVNK